jgi:hypothetical protein
MIQRIAKPQFFCLLLVICTMLTITGATNAQQTNAQIPLKVKGVEGDLALFHIIKVQVENLEKWVAQPDNDHSKFILYIDGNAFKGLSPALVENNTQLRIKQTHCARLMRTPLAR